MCPVEQRHVVRVARRQQHRIGHQPVGQAPGHDVRSLVESEPQAAAGARAAPMEHAAPVRTLPPVELRVVGPLPAEVIARSVVGVEQRHGALGVHARGEVADTARREQARERGRLSRDAADLRAGKREPALARQAPRGPDQPRVRLVVEQSGQQVREQRLKSDLAVANRLQQPFDRWFGPILHIGDAPGRRTRPSSETRDARAVGRQRHRGSSGGSRCSAPEGRSSRCRCDWRPASTASSGVGGPRARAPGPRASWRLRPRSQTRMARGGVPTLRPRAPFQHRLAGGPPFPPGCRGGRSPARGRRARPARQRSRAAGCCGRPVAGTAAWRARRP